MRVFKMELGAQIASLFRPKDKEIYSGPFASSLEILVLQPTPFCNINCDYCYLPHRNDTHRMSLDTIKASVKMVVDGGLIDRHLSVVWHAGEPLVLPVSYYREAFAAIEEIVQGRFSISHSFQTNGTLIDKEWCKFFQQQPVRIGLSIDGPAFLHDLHRKTRSGKGTHEQTMQGVQCLREHGIQFHVIAVISAHSLDHADAIFRFFEEHKIREVGFNVEELEGDHATSSLNGEATFIRMERFWERLYELQEAAGGAIDIREFRKAAQAIVGSKADAPWQEIARRNDQVLPFRIVSVDWQGNVSTFSPELLGTRDPDCNDFIFGDVHQYDLTAIQSTKALRQVGAKVWKGVEACARSCEYFSVCGGGAPSNKYFEKGTFESTETMYCRTSIQMPVRVVLGWMEEKVRSSR